MGKIIPAIGGRIVHVDSSLKAKHYLGLDCVGKLMTDKLKIKRENDGLGIVQRK